MILGIVSFGAGCATFENPGFYSRVNQVLPWIKGILNNGKKCQKDEHDVTPRLVHENTSNSIISHKLTTSRGGFMEEALQKSSCLSITLSLILSILWNIKLLTYDILCFKNPLYFPI